MISESFEMSAEGRCSEVTEMTSVLWSFHTLLCKKNPLGGFAKQKTAK